MTFSTRFAAPMISVLLAISPIGSLGASTSDLPGLSVAVFPGGYNWPIWVALDKGFFADEKIHVELTNSPNSTFQLTGLIEGKFEIAMSAFDNAVAYSEGQGATPLPPQPDIFVFMGADNGMLVLIGSPDVKALSDLKGRTLSVDAMTTGYAFALLDLLSRAGLQPADYHLVEVGGGLTRWQELLKRQQDATLLATPFDIMADAAGFNVLERGGDVYPHFQGIVGVARRSWARAHPEQMIGYIRGYVKAVSWLEDTANRAEALQLLRAHLPQMSEEVASESYRRMVADQGFTPLAKFDLAGARQVLALRSQYAQPKKQLTDPMKYVDESYYDRALKK